MLTWNSEKQCYTVSDWELDYSIRRSIYRLSALPELCKFVKFDFNIAWGKWFTLKNKYPCKSANQVNFYVDKIIYCCRYLNIKYKISKKTDKSFIVRVDRDCPLFSGDIPSPVNYVNDYVDRYKVIYTNELAYEKPEGVWNPADKHWDFPEDALTISDKRNVNKLLQIPDACKIIDFKEITRTKYGYIVRNFWKNNNKETITKQLNYITELCEALNIPYTDAQVRFGSAQGWMWWIQVFKDELSRQQAISERNENMSKPSDDPSDQNDYIMNLPEDSDAALCVLQVGDRVNHDKLGEGTVVKVFDKDIVAVEFDSGRKHSILATHPKLHKLLQGTC